MVNRTLYIILVLVAGLMLTQCRAKKSVISSVPPVAEEEIESKSGLEGLRNLCELSDTINSVFISKAEAVFESNDERYEALVSIYALRDSLIYMSVVNKGFEIIRALVDADSIKVIDRLNKIVYVSPVRKRFGHQNPVDFVDIQNLISRYFLCEEIDMGQDIDFSTLGFYFNKPHIKKSIILNSASLKMQSFEFVHSETRKYFMGERSESGFKIFSNFMVDEFEVLAKGGTLSYNRSIEIKTAVNRKKYTFVNF